jgi:hypothetical protein
LGDIKSVYAWEIIEKFFGRAWIMGKCEKFSLGQIVSHKDAHDLRFKIVKIITSTKEGGENAYDCQLIDGRHSQNPPTGWMTAEEISCLTTLEEI